MGALTERIRRLNAAVNAHDLNPIGDMYAEDAELVWPGLGAISGRQAVVAFYARILGAFPDVHVTIRRIVEEADAFAVTYTSVGSNAGPLPLPSGDLPATNKSVTIDAASVGTTDSTGRIKTQREYFDQVEILMQLGLMPSPAEAVVS